MIWIAVWFTLLVTNATDLVEYTLNDASGWGPIFSMVFTVGSTYFLVDTIKGEFFDG